tara:strand:- start:2251 stop:2910 length:660 start_codon:yes stop_codon:yes gene_type:complete
MAFRHGCSSRVRSRRIAELCAQARERAGVGDVGAGLVSTTSAASTSFAATTSTLTTTASAAEIATALATAASFAATGFTTTTTSLTTELTTTTAAASTSATLTGRRSEHAVTVELDMDLLLALTLTLSLGSLTGDVGLLLFLTGQSLALRELLAATLVGLANVLGSKGELLLSLLNEVGGVGLALVFRLRLGLVLALGSIGDSILLFGLGDSFTGLLVF